MAANTSNNLLDRYVYAVSRYLSPYRQGDLLNELAANLHSEMEDKAAEIGRPLTEDEQSDVLRRHGPPLLVAARYQPQRSLIGPELFPFYAFTVTRLLPLVIGINLLAQAVSIIFAPEQTPIAQRFHFGAMLGGLFYAVLMFLAIVTAAFALIEVYKVDVRRGEPGNVIFTVEDNGPGVAPEITDRLFGHFATSKPRGMGLGLAIARSVIEAHGGRIWHEPRSPGSAFRFTLPSTEPHG